MINNITIKDGIMGREANEQLSPFQMIIRFGLKAVEIPYTI